MYSINFLFGFVIYSFASVLLCFCFALLHVLCVLIFALPSIFTVMLLACLAWRLVGLMVDCGSLCVPLCIHLYVVPQDSCCYLSELLNSFDVLFFLCVFIC